MDAVTLLRAAYQPLLELADEVDDERGWLPTRLPGWTVRDALFHLAGDCQRALVALGSPTDEPPDTDAVSYWSEWKPGTDGAKAGLRGTRIMASVWTTARGPAGLFAETGRAVLVIASRTDASSVVGTQGRRLTVDSLLRTLCVEATVHHLDLDSVLARRPAAEALAETRRALDGLLGTPAPASWDDIRYCLVGTGRLPLSDEERLELGALSERFPLFG